MTRARRRQKTSTPQQNNGYPRGFDPVATYPKRRNYGGYYVPRLPQRLEDFMRCQAAVGIQMSSGEAEIELNRLDVEADAANRAREEERAAAERASRITAEAAVAAALEAPLQHVRERALGLLKVAEMAKKWGLDSPEFDAVTMIGGSVSLEAARTRLLDMAAEADEALETRTLSTSHTVRDANGEDDAKAGYDRAIAKVAAEQFPHLLSQ